MEKELNMKDIEDLLKEIKPSIKKYNENKNRRMETGFNLFYLISDYYYRETFHGDIIAALLDPNEKHGYNNLYTNLFIDMVNLFSNVSVNKLLYTAPNVIKEFPTDDGTLRGRIDIFIEGNVKDEEGKRHCIVIENKLKNANDTEQQLPKYARDLKKRGLEIDAFVYMPLDPNKEPNKSDWGNEKEEINKEINKKLVIIPAYKPRKVNLIDKWLKPALKKSKGDASFVIQQYIRVLNNLTIDIMDNKKIIEVLSKKDNIETTLAILENSEAFYNAIINTFIQKLGNLAEKKGYQLSHKGTEEIEICNKIWKYRITRYNSNGRYYRRIVVDNGIKIKPENYFKGNPNDCRADQPLGENYFDEDLSYWNKPSTIREMHNGSFANAIIKEVEDAFNRMEELSK